MDVKAVELSDEALRGIGRVLTPRERQAVDAGAEFHYAQTNGSLGLEAPLSSGSLECAPRPQRLSRMERHLKTPELLVALDGDATVCVAPPQEAAEGTLQGITAVKMRAGEVMILERGAWHWIPYPHGRRTVRFLVVFRASTGQDDLHFCDLVEPRTVTA
jgi:ureidoglycolate hydrolase